MKQFVYMNMNEIYSIISQSQQGLTLEKETEAEETQSGENLQSKSGSFSATFGGSLVKLAKAEGQIQSIIQNENKNVIQNMTKEIAKITLHDAAFDIAYSSVEGITQDKLSECKIGKYVTITDEFEFLDLEYLKSLFSDKKFIDMITDNEVSNTRINSSTSQGKHSAHKVSSKQDIKNKYIGIKSQIEILTSIIPYKRMLISNKGFLVPLDDSLFRDSSSIVGFKYGGRITCFGLITNRMDSNLNENVKSITPLSGITSIVNKLIKDIFLKTIETIYLLNPIAIYYEID